VGAGLLDLQWIRKNPEALDESQRRRGEPVVARSVIALDDAVRELQSLVQEKRFRRNTLSKEIGKIKSSGGDVTALITEVAACKSYIKNSEAGLRFLKGELDEILIRIPNILADDVPDSFATVSDLDFCNWIAKL